MSNYENRQNSLEGNGGGRWGTERERRKITPQAPSLINSYFRFGVWPRKLTFYRAP